MDRAPACVRSLPVRVVGVTDRSQASSRLKPSSWRSPAQRVALRRPASAPGHANAAGRLGSAERAGQAIGVRDGRRPPPREAAPPLRPALAARSRSCAKLRFSLGTLAPPRRAISRRRSGSIAANPRRLGRRSASSLLISMTVLFSFTGRDRHPAGLEAGRRQDPPAASARRETPPASCLARTRETALQAAGRDPSGLAWASRCSQRRESVAVAPPPDAAPRITSAATQQPS